MTNTNYELERFHAIELALMTTAAMRNLNGQFIQVGQFTTSTGTFNFLYDRSSKIGTYRNAQLGENGSIFNSNANMSFETEYIQDNIGDRLIVTKTY